MIELKVYCIIVTYNGTKWIDHCLQSLKASRYQVKIIVIDNASTDNTISLIAQNFPEVALIQQTANLGFGQANNIGLRRALKEKADYVFLLNQDTWINEDTIEKLVEVAQNNPGYGILSPFHLDATTSNFEKLFLDLFDRYNKSIVPDMFFKRLRSVYEISYIHAAGWFISRNCITTTGGFDPLYFHYGEDDDYLQRVKHFNFKIGLVPSATIVHDASYNTWEKLEWNKNRNLIIAFQQLKKMSPHFRTNVLAYFKNSFDELTTLLLFRKFKKFRFRSVIFLKTLFRISKIYSSYKTSFTEGAFLE